MPEALDAKAVLEENLKDAGCAPALADFTARLNG